MHNQLDEANIQDLQELQGRSDEARAPTFEQLLESREAEFETPYDLEETEIDRDGGDAIQKHIEEHVSSR